MSSTSKINELLEELTKFVVRSISQNERAPLIRKAQEPNELQPKLNESKKIGVLVAKYTTIPSKSHKKQESSSDYFDAF